MNKYLVPDSGLTSLSAAELAEKIHSREVTSREVTQAHLDRINDVDGTLHAFLHVGAEEALAAADAVDESLDKGEAPASALAGVPLALKDVFVTTDAPTTCASKMLEGYVAPYDATVTKKIREAGIPILGKTNMDEFAMGSSTENSAYGPTLNPWDIERTPGGSGGGTSAALASGEAPLGIGTDTGGSIRQPAALTNTVGVKPTYGTVSRYGLVACASSLDQGGPTARTVLDTALLHEVIAGHDKYDATSVNRAVAPVVAAAREGARGDLKGTKIGVVKQFDREGYQPGVLEQFHKSVEQLTAQGAEIVEVDCPHFDDALAAYYLILPCEVSSNLARFDGMRYGLREGDDGTHSAEEVMSLSRAAGFGPEVKRRIILAPMPCLLATTMRITCRHSAYVPLLHKTSQWPMTSAMCWSPQRLRPLLSSSARRYLIHWLCTTLTCAPCRSTLLACAVCPCHLVWHLILSFQLVCRLWLLPSKTIVFTR